MKLYIKTVDKINALLKVLLGVFVVVSLIVMAWQITARFVLNSPLSWSSELVSYLLVWITFIGAAVAVRYSKLIRLEFLFNLIKFPKKVEKGIRALASILTMVFCVIILIYSWEILEVVHAQKSSSMKIPMSIPYSAIPIGSFIMILNVIVAWLDGENENEGEGAL